ncbi:MAG TPA: hypothetical protein VFF68_07690, partial [Anaerolineaceae bacterium]|nr:hypothetical protein [Anaerolineaceae bacterium]
SDESGEVSALTARWEPAIEPLHFQRLPDGRGVEGVSRLAGRYDRPDKEIRVTAAGGKEWVFPNRVAYYEVVAGEQGGVFLLVSGEPPRELLPDRALEFRVKGKPAERVEFIEENGKITGLDFVQEDSVIRAEKPI